MQSSGIGILIRFVSLKLVRSRCGDSSTPQDTDSAKEMDESASNVRRRLPTTRCGDQRSPVSLSVDTLESMNKVLTANADKSSAAVKLAKRIDELAAVVVGYGMVPLTKSSRAKPGSFEDRSRDSSSCARTVCPFFRSALSHAAPFFSDVAGRFAPCIVNPISHQKKFGKRFCKSTGVFFITLSRRIQFLDFERHGRHITACDE